MYDRPPTQTMHLQMYNTLPRQTTLSQGGKQLSQSSSAVSKRKTRGVHKLTRELFNNQNGHGLFSSERQCGTGAKEIADEGKFFVETSELSILA